MIDRLDQVMNGLPPARQLRQRFDPVSGNPMRVGRVWPPRPVLHNIARHGRHGEVQPEIWLMHVLRGSIEVTLRPSDEPAVDDSGRTIGGLQVELASGLIPSSRAPGIGAGLMERPEWSPVALTVRWDTRFAQDMAEVRWVRKAIYVELSDGTARRVFQWYLYLTPGEAEVPAGASRFDHDLPHYVWVDDEDHAVVEDGVAASWVELPAPMSSPRVSPACWVQPPDARRAVDAEEGPATTGLVAVYPVEPPIAAGVEAVGWNGALGGHDPRPKVQSLAVHSHERGGRWSARLAYWATPPGLPSQSLARPTETVLEAPTRCVWPVLQSRDDRPVVLYDLVGASTEGRQVRINLRVGLPPDSEGVVLRDAEIRLGARVVGHWHEGPVELTAGQTRNLRCRIDLASLRDAADGRLKFTMVFRGRPSRGAVHTDRAFRTDNGPYARLMRARVEEGGVRTPWLCIDLGTEGTCASVAFLDGFVPRVINVNFDDGPIYPSRVYLSEALGGVYTLDDEPEEGGLYTTLIKLGLRFGDGAHPGCPDHIAATEVARFFLKRFLLEVRERMAWFPLAEADVLVSFPPRLASMPRFVRSLKETFTAVLSEVVWRHDAPRGLWFREEAFLVSVPCLYRDLQLSPLGPGRSRYYWVMDFGGGTTDVCGFLCTADDYGEEHTVRQMTYPQRLPHHLSGNDVTRAFYGVLYQELVEAGVVAGPEPVDDGSGRRLLSVPPEPFPTARATPEALRNQAVLRELADALKCLEPEQWNFTTLRMLARTLPATTLRTVAGVNTTLHGLLGDEAAALGSCTAAQLHAVVLDPTTGGRVTRIDDAAHPVGTTEALCTHCGHPTPLPRWVFASHRTFRFRCRACGQTQRVHLDQLLSALPTEADDESAPVITAYRDQEVQAVPAGRGGALHLDQDGATYEVRDMPTLRRWVEERRVGPEDLLSEGGGAWLPLRERPELADLFHAAEVLSVDITQEVPRHHYREMVYPEPRGEIAEGDRPMLGRDIRLFLAACRQALEDAVAELPDPGHTEVVVLVAGRASQYPPIAEGIHTFLPGRVVHLTNDWARRSYGHAGQIDPSADLKTMAVNGGGLFALLSSNVETSHLVLNFDTLRMDCPVYLQSAVAARPWLLTRRLDLRPGHAMELVDDGRGDLVDDEVTQVGEPPPRPLPPRTPITGELRLVVDGLPEDRSWEPYVAIAQGTARRRRGRRARTLTDTRLVTHTRTFELGPLTEELSVVFHRMLPDLPLLGGARPEQGPFAAEGRSVGRDPTTVEAPGGMGAFPESQ